MLQTDKPGRQNYWVILLSQLKWCRLYLTFSYSHFYFSIHVLCDHHVLSIIRHTEELYYHFYSGSLTPCWEVQASCKPSMGKVHQAMFQGIVKYRFSSVLQQFFLIGVQWQFDFAFILGLVLIPLGKFSVNYSSFYVRWTQSNPIFSAGFHKLLTPFTVRNVF